MTKEQYGRKSNDKNEKKQDGESWERDNENGGYVTFF